MDAFAFNLQAAFRNDAEIGKDEVHCKRRNGAHAQDRCDAQGGPPDVMPGVDDYERRDHQVGKDELDDAREPQFVAWIADILAGFRPY
jgi:hypothetical protein